MATKDILEGRDLEDTYYRLLTHLTNLFTADYAYLTRFDPSTQNIVLVADTRNLIQSFDSKLWESKERDPQIRLEFQTRIVHG